MFSKLGIEHEGFIEKATPKISAKLRMERVDGRVMERSRFMDEMHDDLYWMKYRPRPEDRSTIRDLRTSECLGMVWEMHVGLACGYANWRSGIDPDILEAVPCWELIQISTLEEQLDWKRRWMDSGGQLYGERMIAKKGDAIWWALSDFGLPWPPFKIDSGYGVRSLRWREAVALGLVTE
ncbi:hypothetical protein OVA24_06335 [Luteolibacter sp. SL250]|uniref:hypothetical protein n=1 Tax=Luteolibacter sp. SL250 TaxID=2995170 RepID=UPI002270EAF4|nr:hypothetical protein [Luteolibacter sp. SL250]WAC20999.1 hypothetical protein OVA24_06335 [Luteolibacter sp. SL250]